MASASETTNKPPKLFKPHIAKGVEGLKGKSLE